MPAGVSTWPIRKPSVGWTVRFTVDVCGAALAANCTTGGVWVNIHSSPGSGSTEISHSPLLTPRRYTPFGLVTAQR